VAMGHHTTAWARLATEPTTMSTTMSSARGRVGSSLWMASSDRDEGGRRRGAFRTAAC
jgi:hypothetical protein